MPAVLPSHWFLRSCRVGQEKLHILCGDFFNSIGHSRRSDRQQGFAECPRCLQWRPNCASQRTDAMCHKQSFDHLGGAGDQGRRKADAERLRRLEIDEELEVRGQLERHVRGPRAS